jgi:hypothetical protein
MQTDLEGKITMRDTRFRGVRLIQLTGLLALAAFTLAAFAQGWQQARAKRRSLGTHIPVPRRRHVQLQQREWLEGHRRRQDRRRIRAAGKVVGAFYPVEHPRRVRRAMP